MSKGTCKLAVRILSLILAIFLPIQILSADISAADGT